MEFRSPIEVLAVKDNDAAALRRAASGGAFSVLARPIIAMGGIVFGAKMQDGGFVAHEKAETFQELASLQGSAYVQSDISGIFDSVVECLKLDRLVMFVGLPCQCAAVQAYVQLKLRSDSRLNQLLLCDLICHGAPNNELFRAHQLWLARKRKADDGIHSFRFRTKKKGWGLYYYYYYYLNGKKIEVCEPGDSDPYYAAFLRGETYRESCYKCPFSKRERLTDFTIGDYWGIESAHPDFYDPNGVSLLLINSSKGEQFFKQYSSKECNYVVSNIQLASRENHNLNSPTVRPATRDDLLCAIADHRSSGDLKALFDTTLKPRLTVKRLAKQILPSGLYGSIKRIVRKG